jgi:hypothetical protein
MKRGFGCFARPFIQGAADGKDLNGGVSLIKPALCLQMRMTIDQHVKRGSGENKGSLEQSADSVFSFLPGQSRPLPGSDGSSDHDGTVELAGSDLLLGC